MHITVSGKQVDLSDSLQTRVSTQLETIANKYFDHALEAHVTCTQFLYLRHQRSCRPRTEPAG